MPFQIQSLDAETFAPLFTLNDEDLKAKGGLRMVALNDGDFPCRVSLQDATKGETVILLNYEHQSADTPYCARAGIFIREQAASAALLPNQIPAQFVARFMAGRAFDAKGMMIDADVCDGKNIAEMIDRLLGVENTAYVHLHYAKHGCFAAVATKTAPQLD